MKHFILALFSLALLANANIEELTLSAFYAKVVDKTTNWSVDGKPWFVMFYAPWCPHCNDLKPKIQRVAEENNDQINFGFIDCEATESRELCEIFPIKQYPTLYFFPTSKLIKEHNKLYLYQGDTSI